MFDDIDIYKMFDDIESLPLLFQLLFYDSLRTFSSITRHINKLGT